MRRPLRVYAETSVFGGVFDQEFETPSRIFFEQVREGKFTLVTSVLVEDELETAPEPVRVFFDGFLPLAELLDLSEEAVQLQQSYLNAGVVSPKADNDALHVALATVSGCLMVVSWNFRHIVHFQKIPLYNSINIQNGYPQIAIYSPWEVILDHEQDI